MAQQVKRHSVTCRYAVMTRRHVDPLAKRQGANSFSLLVSTASGSATEEPSPHRQIRLAHSRHHTAVVL